MKEIEKRLTKWRDDRKIIRKTQLENLLANILEELTEYARARTNYDKIDALCDICVFCLNADNYRHTDYNSKEININKHIPKQALRDSEFTSLIVANKIITLINKFFKEYTTELTEVIDFCLDSIRNFTKKEPLECLRETIKEIESRTGKYIEEKGKFVKNKGAYSYDEAKNNLKEQYGDNIIGLGETENMYIFNCNGKVIEITKWYKANYE